MVMEVRGMRACRRHIISMSVKKPIIEPGAEAKGAMDQGRGEVEP